MKNKSGIVIGTWLILLAICCITLFSQLRLSYDLGLFLPAPKTPAQQVLIDRLGQGPGARFLLIGLENADESFVDAARQSLLDSQSFTQVLSALPAGEFSDIPDVVWNYRYLLSDTPLDALSLKQAFATRLSELALFSGNEFNNLLQADPTFSALSVLDGLALTHDEEGNWQTSDGTTLLVVETQTPAFDLGGQHAAVDTILQVLEALPRSEQGNIEISGIGAFGIELQQTIQLESRNRSILASLGLALVLLIAYRRWQPLPMAALPLLSGALAGLTAVSVAFSEVHGITLAFGFTLLGVAIDYPLHLFSHSRHQPAETAINQLWPTLRLGAISTIIAYTGIALSGAEGSAQLGTFTAVGLLSAALVTRWVLPYMSSKMQYQAMKPPTNTGNSLRFDWKAVVCMATLGILILSVAWTSLYNGQFWSNDLSALSPVPAHKLERDREFRQAIGTPDLRYVVSIRDADLQRVLADSEIIDEKLRDATVHGLPDRWQAVTRVLPSEQRQVARQAGLPDALALNTSLTAALADTPFAVDAFDRFKKDVLNSHDLPLLQLDDLRDSTLRPFVENHLYFSNGEWVSLISLYGLSQPTLFASWLENQSVNATLVDFKVASENLVINYRNNTLRILLLALIFILVLLLWRLTVSRALWTLANVIAAVLATAAVVYAISGPLNLYHLMALLLVAGLGLDYVLFLGRRENSLDQRNDTHHAVRACTASTFVAFGILGLSAIPALNSLGTTVAIGTVLSFIVAWMGVRPAAN